MDGLLYNGGPKKPSAYKKLFDKPISCWPRRTHLVSGQRKENAISRGGKNQIALICLWRPNVDVFQAPWLVTGLLVLLILLVFVKQQQKPFKFISFLASWLVTGLLVQLLLLVFVKQQQRPSKFRSFSSFLVSDRTSCTIDVTHICKTTVITTASTENQEHPTMLGTASDVTWTWVQVIDVPWRFPMAFSSDVSCRGLLLVSRQDDSP